MFSEKMKKEYESPSYWVYLIKTQDIITESDWNSEWGTEEDGDGTLYSEWQGEEIGG